MNLNPLKKDDSTDALVKALEDANNTGVDEAGNPVVQPASDPAAAVPMDPQAATDPSAVTPVADPAMGTSIDPSVDSAVPAPTEPAFVVESPDLPAGISSDADAHLAAPVISEGTGDNGELDGVKKDALEQLRPLIEKLDLEPADKFDKYLMMLRASDDPALIKPAFDAAQGISGEKEKAQALLDIINEINYITAQK